MKTNIDGFENLKKKKIKKPKWFDTGDDFTYEQSVLKCQKVKISYA